MKRSEMIKTMLDCYRISIMHLRCHEEKAMDKVLELCEELGMLPPEGQHHEYEVLKNGDRQMDFRVWEPENE